MKNCNIISTEKQQNYLRYHQVKFDKYKYLTGAGIFPSNQSKIIEQAKFTYSSLRKALKNKQKQLKIQLKTNKNNQR